MKTYFWARLRESVKSNGPFDPTYRFSTSWLLPPYILFAIRALLSLYSFLVLFISIGLDIQAGRPRGAIETLAYFPYLSCWGLAIYFAVSSIHTFSYGRWGKPFLARWPRTLQRLHSLLYSTIVVFPLLVTVIRGLKYRYYYSYFDVSLHILNTVFAVFEMVVPRTSPIPVWHIFPLLLISFLYPVLEYITYKNRENFQLYFFPDDPVGAFFNTSKYLMFCLMQCVLFFMVHYFIKGRAYFTEPTVVTTVETNDHDLAAFGVRRLSDGSVQKQNATHTKTVGFMDP